MENKEGSSSPTGVMRDQPAPPSAHHALNEAPQGAPFDVLCDEVEPLLLVEHPDKLEHIGMLQAAHHLHLQENPPAPSL